MRIVIVIAMFCVFALNFNTQEALSPEMMFALTNGMPAHRTFNLNRSNQYPIGNWQHSHNGNNRNSGERL